jgi:glycosyltransferase involved in cell wall biosynthesis
MGSSKKKIIIFNPSIEDGGVEKNLVNITNFLSDKFENTILISANENKNYFFKKKIERVFLKTNKKFSRKLRYLISIYLLIKELLKDKSKKLVLSFQANIYCIVICKIFGVKVITRSNASIHGWSKNFKLLLYKYIYSKADSLIVNSLALKYEFNKILKLECKVIYNPLDKKRIFKLYKKKNSKNFFTKESLNIINIGRLVDQKDHMTILKALNEIKNKINYKLIIIGDGTNLKKIKEFIKLNKLKKNIKLIKFNKNPFVYFKNAHFFISSSLFEGLPNAMLEAILLKKFVISTDCPTGPREILKKGEFGALYPPSNFLKLSKLILYYNKNKKICHIKKQKAFNSLNRFDYNKNLNEYYKVIKKELI